MLKKEDNSVLATVQLAVSDPSNLEDLVQLLTLRSGSVRIALPELFRLLTCDNAMNALLVIDALFKTHEYHLVYSLQSCFVNKRFSVSSLPPRAYNFLAEAAPAWVDVCTRLSCLSSSFSLWAGAVSASRFVAVISEELKDKLLRDILLALKVVIDALQNPTENRESLEVIVDRVLELEPVITEEELRDAVRVLCESALIAQRIIDGRIGKRISPESLVSFIRIAQDKIQDILSSRDPPVKVLVGSRKFLKSPESMSTELFFQRFDMLKNGGGAEGP
jgi:hypothetical protein